jgi:hypothetical protein
MVMASYYFTKTNRKDQLIKATYGTEEKHTKIVGFSSYSRLSFVEIIIGNERNNSFPSDSIGKS